MVTVVFFLLPFLLKVLFIAFGIIIGESSWIGVDLMCGLPTAFFFVLLMLLLATSKMKKDESEFSIRIFLGISLWAWVLCPFTLSLIVRP